MRKIKKSKRLTVSIPTNSIIHSFLENNGKVPHWVTLEQLVKQLPKSRADRAVNKINEMVEELTILYPDSTEKWPIIKKYILIQVLGIECTDSGFEECQKKKLGNEHFEELRRI